MTQEATRPSLLFGNAPANNPSWQQVTDFISASRLYLQQNTAACLQQQSLLDYVLFAKEAEGKLEQVATEPYQKQMVRKLLTYELVVKHKQKLLHLIKHVNAQQMANGIFKFLCDTILLANVILYAYELFSMIQTQEQIRTWIEQPLQRSIENRVEYICSNMSKMQVSQVVEHIKTFQDTYVKVANTVLGSISPSTKKVIDDSQERLRVKSHGSLLHAFQDAIVKRNLTEEQMQTCTSTIDVSFALGLQFASLLAASLSAVRFKLYEAHNIVFRHLCNALMPHS